MLLTAEVMLGDQRERWSVLTVCIDHFSAQMIITEGAIFHPTADRLVPKVHCHRGFLHVQKSRVKTSVSPLNARASA